MATTMTHRGITYAQSGSGTTTMNLDLQLNGAVADTNTLTLSGDVSKIVSFVAQRADATANVAIVHTSDLVLTFDMEATADGTTDDLTAMELWLVLG